MEQREVKEIGQKYKQLVDDCKSQMEENLAEKQ